LNIATITYASRSFAILKHELHNVQATSGKTAHDMMELGRPELDWFALAGGMGITIAKATTVDEFTQAMEIALAATGYYVMEARIDS
jgi:acetolactate synthase-1/2/3 large subunit